MHVIRDVVVDLWHFTREELGMEKSSSSSQSPVVESIHEPMIRTDVPFVSVPPSSSSVPSTSAITYDTDTYMQRIMYIAYPDTTCYLRPALVVDTVIGTLSYGTAVTVLSQRDDWVHVQTPVVEGWVERFALAGHIDDVLPQCVVGEVYDAEHPETIKLRTYINDAFGTRVLRCPLLNSEYVWYRLTKEGYSFGWPQVRPRSPGRWSEILRTEPSAHCGTVPMTGCVMEYTTDTHTGEVYYVEAVTPDESVVVSGFSSADDGVFERQTLTHDQWTELRPRFICKK